MSISSEELNYIVWRYMQETGQSLAALALQEESRVLEFDEKYKEHIPVGGLVDLVQKGILYTEAAAISGKSNEELERSTFEEREEYYGSKFTLARALGITAEQVPEIKNTGRFALENEAEDAVSAEDVSQSLHNTSTGAYTQDDVVKSVSASPAATVPIVGYNAGAATQGDIASLAALYTSRTSATVCQWHPENPQVLCLGQRDSVSHLIKFNETFETVESDLELPHPVALSSTTGQTTNAVTCIRWSPDGTFVATGVENGEIRLWTRDAELSNVFSFHRSPLIAMKWSPDAHHLVTMDVDNVAILWSVQSGTVLQHFDLKLGSKNPESLGVDVEWVDDRRFALPGGTVGTIGIYETSESSSVGKLVGHTGAISCLVFNRDNKLLASASDDFTVRIWHGGNSNSAQCFIGHMQAVISLVWLDADRVASASVDGSVRVWSLKQNALVGLLMTNGSAVFAMKKSNTTPTHLAIGCMDGTVHIADVAMLDAALQQPNLTLPCQLPVVSQYSGAADDSVSDLSWSHNGKAIAMVPADGDTVVLATPATN